MTVIPDDHIFKRYRDMVDDYDAFVAALGRPLPLTVWANPHKTTPEKLRARLERDGYRTETIPGVPEGLKILNASKFGNRVEYRAGHLNIQEQVSMYPVMLLDPQPGEAILDMCAAPGSKTMQIAGRMTQTGTIVANDRHINRMRSLRMNQERLGFINITLTRGDASRFLPGRYRVFDRILADVPCTCEGTARKAGGLEFKPIDTKFRSDLAVRQRRILIRALELVKVGGVVVYSTCTFAPEENEAVLHDALSRFGAHKVLFEKIDLPKVRFSSGLRQWNGQEFLSGIEAAARIYPHQNDSGGFFVAVLRRVEGSGRLS